MRRGYLSEYFQGVAAKRLSSVEADVLSSNQHEFNGVEGLRELLGEPDGKVPYEAKMVYLRDEITEPIVEDATVTWYDARQRARIERQVMRWEYRLYFPTTSVSQNFSAGDLLVIGKLRGSGLLIIVAQDKSTISRQIEWLFGFGDLLQPGFTLKSDLSEERDRIGFAARFILESIGIPIEDADDMFLEELTNKFAGKFPTTHEFSAFARSTLKGVECVDDPDAALMAWMEREEILFRTLEKHLITDRISKGFVDMSGRGIDVEGFLSFSLSVQNRRKSRVGLALENHLQFIFAQNNIRCSRATVTENKSKPDFLFPGSVEYHSPNFGDANLTMLGAKSTCKDRWRQVLSEADRISKKHLLTLEAAISTQQTDEMEAKNLQLVVPRKLQETYTAKQRNWLLSLAGFNELVRSRQID